ncbi:DUF1636 domain-containing protein [Nostoc linckia FACHB-391]|uniref:DUF1636 domain-containing protein n=2 Tax=Nostoc TaxID=1177 RepID=A0ABR8IDC2_9NOSO|nr:DUF1636 domain-containing protein [Nostoc linckia FACHB-391]MBD2648723.1 DUF1636 domain-containing protein [Nostoc foliaceum FACHB-393]
MSACNNSCVIAFTAEGKSTYLFGDLPVDGCASAVLECASQYYTKSNGLLSCSEQPEPLKTGILAKIPPLNKWAKLNISCSIGGSKCDRKRVSGKEILATGKTALFTLICW